MNEKHITGESPRDSCRVGRRRSRLGWTTSLFPPLLILILSVPTMAIEESWHGRPMIDEPTHLWIIAACLVVAAFLAGGVVAGHRRPSAAPGLATVAAGLAVAVLVLAGGSAQAMAGP